MFSKTFYSILYGQSSRSICDAFDMAKDCIEASDDIEIKDEYHKFVIIRDIDDFEQIQSDKYYFYDKMMERKQAKSTCSHCQPLGPFNAG